jgi:prepilin-type N-terminal cleavage/methylation domain-containing protein
MTHRTRKPRLCHAARVPSRLASQQRCAGFTLVELLVVIAIISIIAGFLVPTLLRGRGEAYKVQCGNNLREIARSAMIYADGSGKRFFPYAGGANPSAHESLNVMVQFYGSAKKLNPKIFVCPEWRGDPAAVVDDKYELTEDSLAYTWTSQKLSPTDAGFPLSSDKYVKKEGQLNGHEGGMQVVHTDVSVLWVLEGDISGEGGLPPNLVR